MEEKRRQKEQLRVQKVLEQTLPTRHSLAALLVTYLLPTLSAKHHTKHGSYKTNETESLPEGAVCHIRVAAVGGVGPGRGAHSHPEHTHRKVGFPHRWSRPAIAPARPRADTG